MYTHAHTYQRCNDVYHDMLQRTMCPIWLQKKEITSLFLCDLEGPPEVCEKLHKCVYPIVWNLDPFLSESTFTQAGHLFVHVAWGHSLYCCLCACSFNSIHKSIIGQTESVTRVPHKKCWSQESPANQQHGSGATQVGEQVQQRSWKVLWVVKKPWINPRTNAEEMTN